MKHVVLLLFGMFALGADAYVMAGILPQIADSYQVSIGWAGQSVSIFTLCYAIAAPLFAALVSQVNTKQILIGALGLFTIANVLTVLADDYILLLLSRGLAGVGAGLYSPLASAAAVQLAPPERSGRALGLILLGMSAGTVVGVPLGIYISSISDWRWTIGFIASISAIGLAALWLRLPGVAVKQVPTLRERVALFKHRQVKNVMLVTMILSFCSLGLYTYLERILLAYGYSKPMAFLWMWGAGGILGSLAIGFIMDRYRRPKSIVFVLILLLMTSMLLMGPAHRHPFTLAIPLLVWGAAGWASIAAQQKTLVEISAEHAAIAIALLSSINYLAGAFGTMIFGLLLEQEAAPSLLPYIAALALLGAALLHAVRVMDRRSKASVPS